MDINPLSEVSLVNMFSRSVGCLFILLIIFFAVQKVFSLICFFFLLFPLPEQIYQKKTLLQVMSSNILLPMFSSQIFMVWGLIFKSLIHLEFILVYGIRRWSSFIFSMYLYSFSQYHLLNRLSLPHYMFLSLLSNIN